MGFGLRATDMVGKLISIESNCIFYFYFFLNMVDTSIETQAAY